MRRKAITAICALSLLGSAGAAYAVGSIPVAIFPFNTAADIASFVKIAGNQCATKFRASKAMGINVGAGTTECQFRTSVVAEQSDPAPDQDIQATVGFEPKTPRPLQRKLYLGVFTRAGSTSAGGPGGRYELRVVPVKQRWMLVRISGGATTTLGAGTSGVVKTGAGLPAAAKPKKPTTPTRKRAAATTPTKKPAKSASGNVLRLRTAGTSTSTAVYAAINGTAVFSNVDSNPAPPVGHFNGISVGNRTGASATGILGSFDDVTVYIPSPF